MIRVIDTSSLLQVKRSRGPKLWDVLKELDAAVSAGVLTYPGQLKTELGRYGGEVSDIYMHWCTATMKRRRFGDPDITTVRRVLEDPTVQKVADWHLQEDEIADPYVVAMAIELAAEDEDVAVITEESRDRGDGRGGIAKYSLKSCCNTLGVPCGDVTSLLKDLGIEK